jgi:hypothetical protein
MSITSQKVCIPVMLGSFVSHAQMKGSVRSLSGNLGLLTQRLDNQHTERTQLDHDRSVYAYRCNNDKLLQGTSREESQQRH